MSIALNISLNASRTFSLVLYAVTKTPIRILIAAVTGFNFVTIASKIVTIPEKPPRALKAKPNPDIKNVRVSKVL